MTGQVVLFKHKSFLINFRYFRSPIRYVLFAIDVTCLLFSHCVLLAVVMNYVCHCEMIVFYCKAIRTRLEEKSIPLHEAMKRILDLGVSISQLNSSASRMMSVLLIFIMERTILGKLKLNYWPRRRECPYFRFHSGISFHINLIFFQKSPTKNFCIVSIKELYCWF